MQDSTHLVKCITLMQFKFMDYSSGIWGYSKSEEGVNIQNRATIYYKVLHQKHLYLLFRETFAGLELK